LVGPLFVERLVAAHRVWGVGQQHWAALTCPWQHMTTCPQHTQSGMHEYSNTPVFSAATAHQQYAEFACGAHVHQHTAQNMQCNSIPYKKGSKAAQAGGLITQSLRAAAHSQPNSSSTNSHLGCIPRSAYAAAPQKEHPLKAAASVAASASGVAPGLTQSVQSQTAFTKRCGNFVFGSFSH
jgi:hypothetical protein